MLELGVKILIAYLLGTLLGSLILGRLRGVDIRSMGSGNAGATNALRTQGKLFGFLVLLIDIAKGMFGVWWLPSAALPGIGIDPGVSREWLTMACGFAVIVGHVYPVWFDFRGGKGAATVVGVVAAMELRLMVPLLLSWIIVLLLFGLCGSRHHAVDHRPAGGRVLLEPNNVPLLHILCRGRRICDLYPSQQHRAHARRKRKSRAATMAVSIASGIGNTACFLRCWRTAKCTPANCWRRNCAKPARRCGKASKRLRAIGIEVQALARRGYRLARPVELLDSGRIGAELARMPKPCLHSLELLFEVGFDQYSPAEPRAAAAGHAPMSAWPNCSTQGAGAWAAAGSRPSAAASAMSLGWTCSDVVRTLPALSLGVGVAVSRALTRAGAAGITLKWPNDIWFEDRKIGGVLIELRAEAGGPAHVVIGVGINVSLPAAARHEIEASGAYVAAVADACVNPRFTQFGGGGHLGRTFEYAAAIRALWICRVSRCVDGPRRLERPRRYR